MRQPKSLTLIYVSIIALPLLLPGYILSLDVSWGPVYPRTSLDSSLGIFSLLLHLLNFSFGWLPQKIILFLTISLTGLGSYKLFNHTERLQQNRVSHLAAIVYIFNPFFYSRFVAGQWLVLIGYALLPWIILALWKFLQKPEFKTAWPVLAWLMAIGLTSIHTLGIVALVAVVMFFVTIREQVKVKLIWGVGIITSWIVLNLMWLIPFITGSSRSGQSVQSFGESQLQAFATNGTIFDSPVLSALFLTGFWADDQGRYSLPSNLGILWYIAAFLLFALMVTGVAYVIKKKDKLGISITIAGFIAWILAIGVASQVTAPLAYFLHEHLPLYAGYREPQKWLMLLAVAYAYLGTFGLVYTLDFIKERKLEKLVYPITIIACILPILFAPNLARGAGGQLKSVQYPAGWTEAAEVLKDEPKDTKVLVLPWHMYLHVRFADRVVANPTRYYFTQDMIVGNNSELKGVPIINENELYAYINNELLPQRNKITNAGERLRGYGVEYVMLLKEADYRTYGWVNKQTGFDAVLDNDSMTLYRIRGEAK